MTTPADLVRAMFAHHLWATGRLIDHLEGLPPERLDAAVPGTYGSMIVTLTHLVDADARYLRRLEDPTPLPYDARDGAPLAELRTQLEVNRGRWDDVLDALEAGSLHAVVRNHQNGYPDTEPAEGLLLLQAIHHGDDHRTQICSTLGALGEDVPELDGWAFWAQGR